MVGRESAIASAAPFRPADGTGTYAVMLTDIDASTSLWERFGDSMMADIAAHDALLAAVVATAGGHVARRTGDGLLAVFPDPSSAVRAAIDAQRAIRQHRWPAERNLAIRIGVHHGPCVIQNGDVINGLPNLAARLQSIANAGQVLVSQSVATDAVPTSADSWSLVELGLHRLRGFDAAVPVHGVLADGLDVPFGPLDTPSTGAESLTVPTDRFVGRDRELAALDELVASGPVTTIWGPGGAGKTRLALEYAGRKRHRFADGVRLVDALGCGSYERLVGEMVARLRVQPIDGEARIDGLRRALRQSSVLVIVDNAEVSVADVRRLMHEVVSPTAASGFVILSRRPIGCAHERLLGLTGLTPPPDDRLAAVGDSPAVQLFVDRAQDANPSFGLTSQNAAAVAAVCRSVDGLPVAIEFAARRLAVGGLAAVDWGAERIYQLLSDHPDLALRGSVAAMLETELRSLDSDALGVLRKLSVLGHPASPSMLHEFLGDASHPTSAIDCLLQRGLLRHDHETGLIGMLALTREHLRSTNDPRDQLRWGFELTQVVIARAARFDRQLRTNAEHEAVASLTTEFGEMRTAMRFLLANSMLPEASELLASLATFCLFQPRPELFDWASELAVDIGDDSPHAPGVLGAAALGAWCAGNGFRAIELGERAIGIAARNGAPAPWARTALVDAYGYAGEFNALIAHFVSLIRDLRRTGDEFWIVNALGHEAIGAITLGDRDLARRKVDEALQRARSLDNPDCRQWAMYAYGRLLAPDDPRSAIEAYWHASRIAASVGSRFNASLSAVERVTLLREHGRLAEAASDLRGLVDLLEVSGNRSQLSGVLREVGLLLVQAGLAEPAGTVLLARRGMPSMPKHATETQADGSALIALETRIVAEHPQLRIRAAALTEHELIDLAKNALTDAAFVEPSRSTVRPT